MNAGVSLHKTVFFPKFLVPKSIRKSTISGFVWLVGMISKSCKYRGGLKKWVPQKCDLKSSDLPSTIRFIGIPEVFEEIIVPVFRCCSTRSNKFFLMSNCSTTTSIIQSQVAILSKSSSKFPVVILETKVFL